MADSEPTEAPEQEQDDIDALEIPEADSNTKPAADAGEEDQDDDSVTDATSSNPNNASPLEPPSKGFKGRMGKFNIYLLMFFLILLIAGVIIIVAYFQGKKQTTTTLKTQDLTKSTLQQLATSDASVGSAQQVLNIQSSAVFAGKVLIRDGLDVATTLRVGGSSSLNGLDVTGNSQLQQVTINKDLSVSGNSAVQGSATVAKSLQVNGTANFAGAVSAPQITTTGFQLNGDLTLTHHIIAGGVTPGSSRGTALGNGGTTSNSGSDTSGNVVVNVGSSAGAGCFVTINFAAKYANTPHVLITPVGSGSGNLDYYVNRSSSSFSICDATPPPPGSYGFDYIVID